MIEWMPILSCDREKPGCPQQIPMAMLDNETALNNHGQSLQRLKERHGIGVHEAIAIHQKTHWSKINPLPMPEAIALLNKLIDAHLATL